MFCGIDVGLKRSVAAVVGGRRLLWVGNYEDLDVSKVKAAGIDAPLSFPASGNFRECERELQKRGITLFPPAAPFFRKIAERGIEIAEELRAKGVEVFEVYPYATRVALGIAPKAKKRTKGGLATILRDLRRYVDVPELNHDEVDAVIAALTVELYFEGRGEIVIGRDGSILVPKMR